MNKPVSDPRVMVTGKRTGASGLPASESRTPIEYGVIESPFGDCLAAISRKGICYLAFIDSGPADAIEDLARKWPEARLSPAPEAIEALTSGLFSPDRPFELALHLAGTEFQVSVWQTLRQIPLGTTVTYRWVAEQIGRPAATRAVGTAVGRNALAYLIPCHRVCRSDGSPGKYRWGIERKAAILDWERAAAPAESG